MAENLNYKTSNSWCYNDNKSNCAKYGRLYDWNTALSACPAGWHLPSREEWGELAGESCILDGYSVSEGCGAGRTLKSNIGWEKDGNGSDNYGFSALPGGLRSSGGVFYNAGNNGYWWTATELSDSTAFIRGMSYEGDRVSVNGGNGIFKEGVGLSVRCIAD
jgi:uncharacterized protein (TIGR02145 family)